MAVKRAQLVISEAGRVSLMTAGITTGWISAWMQSAGFDPAELCALESNAWKGADACQVFIATNDELNDVAGYFSNKPLVTNDVIPLTNPDRDALLCTNENSGVQILLLPTGDIAYQRHLWLTELAGGRPLQPLSVWMGDEGGIELEPGLRGSLAIAPDGKDVMNEAGLLPEEQLLALLKKRNLKVRFAESCTGGGMSERLSRVPGSSGALDRSWVTYSNQAKQDELGVPKSLINKHGAVSREVVEAMACAGRDEQHACVVVSGIAGPSGGSSEKPVGTVWLAIALPNDKPLVKRYLFPGSRAEIRARSILAGFSMSVLSLR